MPQQDTSELKEKIISIFRIRGPCLPVHIAKEIGLSILFTSAFLSELISDKEIKISYMKVGSSPIYFIPGQEPKLENFSQHLQSKEKDAFALLKQKRFLKDKEQEPAIRVALRSIKDFAFAFKRNEEIYWRYQTIPETEFIEEKPKKQKSKDDLNIFDKDKKISSKDKSAKELMGPSGEKTAKGGALTPFQKQKPKKKLTKQNEFFNKVKEFLSKKSIEILDIESFSKNELILRVNSDGKEELTIAYNKKRITETDLIKAYKKAADSNLPYTILSLGEPSKKIKELLIALKNLSKIDKLE